MYEPKFELSHQLVNNIVKLELEKKSVEVIDIARATEDLIVNESRTFDIFHLAHMTNMEMTLRMAKRVVEGKTILEDGLSNRILNNFRNAMEYIRSLPVSYGDLDPNSFLHLNKIILNGWRDTWEVKFRTGGEQLDLRIDPWGQLMDSNISSAELQSAVYSVIEWYNSTQSQIHPLLRIAVVIYRLIRISPFVVGNKLTILAIAEMLFYQTGYSTKEFLPLLKTFDIFEEEYFEAWSTAMQNGDDCTLWIERFVRNVANELLHTRERMSKVIDEEQKKNKQPFLDLNKRQLKILRYLQTIPFVKREDYVQMLTVSTMTAFRDLNELVEKKLLRVEGKGRGTRYTLITR